MITKTPFDIYNGKQVSLYILENEKIKAGVLDYGGVLNFIKLKTPEGEKDMCVTYKSVKAYEGKGYCSATVGRVANRIKGSAFTIEGKQYNVSANENGNCLHGGAEGFDKRFFDAEIKGETLALSLVSPDGDMGFPGNLEFKVEFSLDGGTVNIVYTGKCDKATPFSPTCHAYFNLNGGGEVLDTLLKINAEGYTPVDGALIPLGTVESVKGTPYDFTEPKRIGKDIGKVGAIGTYDINFALSGNPAVEAVSGDGKVKMTMQTDFCGVQLYVGRPSEYINGEGGYGFCLEPQYFPNAINQAGFEKPVLKAGEEAKHFIKYSFELI